MCIRDRIISHIDEEDIPLLVEKDLESEKGYFNSVNHILAQSFMTTLFSEDVAELVAEAHERKNLPELVNGNFTPEQIIDLETGPLDNYVDIINNEWGQQLGNDLKGRFHISRNEKWTSKLLTDYLNALQSYFSWSFQIGFKPFRQEDEIVDRFLLKLNSVIDTL